MPLQEVKSEIRGIESYAVGGTPGDSVIMAINLLAKDKFDLAVSGINNGPNLGVDIFQSGTVGGAMQAFLHGLPAIAVSVDAIDHPDNSIAARFIAILAEKMQDEAGGKKYLLNVNVPATTLQAINGVKTTRFITSELSDVVEEGHDGRRHYYWLKYKKSPVKISRVTDAWAVTHGYISITPLHKLLFGQNQPSLNGHFSELLKDL